LKKHNDLRRRIVTQIPGKWKHVGSLHVITSSAASVTNFNRG